MCDVSFYNKFLSELAYWSPARPPPLLGALLLKSFGKHVGVLGLLWAAFVVAYAWPAAQSSFGAQLEELRDQALAFAAPATATLQLLLGL